MIKEYENEHYILYSLVTEDGVKVYGYAQKNIGIFLTKLEASMRKNNRNNGISFVTQYNDSVYNISIAALMILEFELDPKDIPNCLWSCALQDYHGSDLVIAVEPNFEDVTQKDVHLIEKFVSEHKAKLINHFNKSDIYFEWYI